MNLFDDPKIAFVTVSGDAFLVAGKTYSTLRCLLHKAQKIRKFFRHGKLACYSHDATVSHTGAYCVFCNDRFRCQRKVRLSMLLIDGPRLLPVILDVNQGSFANLQAILDQLGDDLHRIPVNLKLVYDDNDRRCIEFTT
jgi:hypothetical protein